LSDEQLERRQWGFRPACQQISQREGQGRLLIKGSASGDSKAVEQRIQNVAERAAATQPERKVVSVDALDDGLEVLTTPQKLAHRLAHETKRPSAEESLTIGVTRARCSQRGTGTAPKLSPQAKIIQICRLMP
jgi:hypothetical protein